jgi:Uma2 family endonuclease
MVLATRNMPLEQFLRLPEEEPALEYEQGMVTQKVSPKGKHSRLQPAICEIFDRLARPRRLALAFSELRVTFSGRSYVPDVALYRWDRIPVDERGQVADVFTEPPDLVVEIVSPDQSTNALIRRCLWFVAHGVQVALLVDPLDDSVILFRPATVPQALHGLDRIDLEEILPGLDLTAHALFDTLNVR